MAAEEERRELLDRLVFEMVRFDAGDPQRIQHFTKVRAFAELIGRAEGLSADELLTLVAAATVHDIGIRPALEKYGHETGKLQEQEGHAPARKMLEEVGFPSSVVDRVCYLVAHHHTYDAIDGLDYQILVEADFLVNLYENRTSERAQRAALANIFRTKTGIELCTTMFGI